MQDAAPPAPPRQEALSHPDCEAEVARIRDGGLLGRAGRLSDLFDYLLQRSLNDDPPKEVEIVSDVFSKGSAPASDDAVARVYIHRLRKRLEEIAANADGRAQIRLTIPRGEYRLVAERIDVIGRADAAENNRQSSALDRLPRWVRGRAAFAVGAFAACALLLGNIVAWSLLADGDRRASRHTVADSAHWAPVVSGEGDLLLVVGDYYMFGEYEDRLFLKRLIRDFSINSKEDLVESYLTTPEAFDQYGDVALQYLPTSTAFALADLAPVIADRDVRIALASELTDEQLKENDILYVGLTSGLGKLLGPVFTRSRFELGESFDIIHDTEAGRTYTSEAFLAAPSDAMYRDYGLFKSFLGPAGNQIIVLAGTRDTALMGLSEILVAQPTAQELEEAGARPFEAEALFEVQGHKHINLRARLIAAGPVESAAVWSSAPSDMPVFPTE